MKVLVPLLVALLLLNACAQPDPADTATDSTDTTSTGAAPSPAAGPYAPSSDTPPASAEKPGFDLDAVPLSTAVLGEFPYIGLPTGYAATT